MGDLKKNRSFSSKIENAVKKFELNLSGKTVLTEAATGNFVVTPVIAAASGADVVAFTKESRYGSVEMVKQQTYELSETLNLSNKIKVYENDDKINYDKVDIMTNTGFLRPINEKVIKKLNKSAVIPLMWEPWEYRKEELDLSSCLKHGIKVYGTNEDDLRLRTKDYIGFIVLKLLLNHGVTPLGNKILILGGRRFTDYVDPLLKRNAYQVDIQNDYEDSSIDINKYNVIICLEHENNKLLIGDSKEAFISKHQFRETDLVIHICGNIDFTELNAITIPENPSEFGYMSYTTDYVSEEAVIDLHCAGLKVAEGMILANEMNLFGKEYKRFMEENYPALAFEEEKYW